MTWPITPGSHSPVRLNVQDWALAQGYLDAQGHRTNSLHCGVTQTEVQCLQADKYRANYMTYQPAKRFWTFQWMETGLYLAIAALAVALTAWLVSQRRLA